MFHVEHRSSGARVPAMFHVEHLGGGLVISVSSSRTRRSISHDMNKADAAATEPPRRKQELEVRSPGSFVVLLLPSRHCAWLSSPVSARGHLALAASLPGPSELLLRAWSVSWLGPGLLIAVLLLVTLRRSRRVARKPLHRSVRAPELERYRGVVPRRHQDLEV
jgi:hypothetical protein